MSRHETVRTVQLKGNFFSPYGRILEPSAGESPEVSEPGAFDFFVLFKELCQGVNFPGWQIGYLSCTCRYLHQLERHPNTAEVFCPLDGKALLVVAGGGVAENGITGGAAYKGTGPLSGPKGSPGPGSTEGPVGFALDRPIVFNRGVWHGVISLTEKSTVLIVESPDVIDEFRTLERPLAAP